VSEHWFDLLPVSLVGVTAAILHGGCGHVHVIRVREQHAFSTRDQIFAFLFFGFARLGFGLETSFALASVAFECEVVLP
jgi:hypothetical protein